MGRILKMLIYFILIFGTGAVAGWLAGGGGIALVPILGIPGNDGTNPVGLFIVGIGAFIKLRLGLVAVI